MKDRLLERFQARAATVAVIGLGYVGLPLADAFCRAGFTVVGFDIDADKVARLNRGVSYLKTIPDATVAGMRATGLSIMPEGLVDGMPPQMVADLIAFIQSGGR